MSFEVKTDVFQGPFDLLLKLILEKELDICDVPIAVVTDEYIRHVESLGALDLEVATEFLVVAATLLLMKARALLSPGEPEVEESASNVVDELADRLIAYRGFQNAAAWLGSRLQSYGYSLGPLRELEEEYAHLYPDPFSGVPVEKLAESLVNLLAERVGAVLETDFIAPIKVSVAEYMERVRSVVREKTCATFSELIKGALSKIEVIATFLAVLELFRNGEIDLSQREAFGEIELSLAGRAGG